MRAIIALSFMVANLAMGQISPMAEYQYTDLKSMQKATEIWNSMKKRELQRSSECFNRAHTWAYDMWKDYGVLSRKIFIHFTYKYNKELSSKWGYHIAPMISVNNIDYVMDRKYFDGPVTISQWQDFFVEHATKKLESERRDLVREIKSNERKIIVRERNGTGLFHSSPNSLRSENRKLKQKLAYLQVSVNEPAKITCPFIDHIEQIDFNPTEQWCYLQQTSMYYWGYPQLRLLNYGTTQIPNRSSLPELRANGQKVVNWNMDQVWTARKEAFRKIDELWPYEYAIRKRQ